MIPYEVVLTAEARAEIRRLATAVQKRILDRLTWLGDNAEQFPHHALQGREWNASYRFRVGDYRVIYQIGRSARIVTVLRVGHRRDIYR